MMATIEEMIDLLWSPPRGPKRIQMDRKLPENFKYYDKWGFAIYRTYYGPESAQKWKMLLGALRQQTLLAFGCYDKDIDDEDSDEEENGVDVEILKKLFHLDPREDAARLDGLDVRGLRKVCQTEEFSEPGMAARLYRFVLLADEAVIKDISNGEFIVKAVAYDWKERGENWGWMRVPTGYLLELWQTLMTLEYNTHRVLRFVGPEKELETYVWPGDLAIDPSGNWSEIRPRHRQYKAQHPDRSGTL